MSHCVARVCQRQLRLVTLVSACFFRQPTSANIYNTQANAWRRMSARNTACALFCVPLRRRCERGYKAATPTQTVVAWHETAQGGKDKCRHYRPTLTHVNRLNEPARQQLQQLNVLHHAHAHYHICISSTFQTILARPRHVGLQWNELCAFIHNKMQHIGKIKARLEDTKNI